MSNPLASLWGHPDELYSMVKLKLAVIRAKKHIPTGSPHWRFCYSIFYKHTRGVGLIGRDSDTEFCDVVCISYLVLRALDTIEDKTSIANEVKVPMLKAFHRHIYDHDWKFSCGTKDHEVLLDKLHLVRTAFLELELRYRDLIEDVTMKMGSGLAKFISKEVVTLADYDEYCHYASGIPMLGLLKLCYLFGKEHLAEDSLCNSIALFLSKTDAIVDYLEDIDEQSVPKIIWPHEIWSKYANKLEDLKYEENSVAALQCLNEMVTNALVHAEDTLKFLSTLREPDYFHFCAFLVVCAFGRLALCYNNIQVFRGSVEIRLGLAAKLYNRTRTMADVYRTCYHFSLVLKSKVDNDKDPNAKKTKDWLDSIMKICWDSGTLDPRKPDIALSNPKPMATLVCVLFTALAILLAYGSPTRSFI